MIRCLISFSKVNNRKKTVNCCFIRSTSKFFHPILSLEFQLKMRFSHVSDLQHFQAMSALSLTLARSLPMSVLFFVNFTISFFTQSKFSIHTISFICTANIFHLIFLHILHFSFIYFSIQSKFSIRSIYCFAQSIFFHSTSFSIQ